MRGGRLLSAAGISLCILNPLKVSPREQGGVCVPSGSQGQVLCLEPKGMQGITAGWSCRPPPPRRRVRRECQAQVPSRPFPQSEHLTQVLGQFPPFQVFCIYTRFRITFILLLPEASVHIPEARGAGALEEDRARFLLFGD